MFDFLKKSRAVKFLCSACLLCSLGSFAVSADDNPVKVADAYVKGELGYDANKIVLDSATLSMGTTNGGKLSGTLKWRGANDESGNPATLIDLDNDQENAGITFYLAEQGSLATDQQLAVSDQKDLDGYSFEDVQFFASGENDKIGAAKPMGASKYEPTAPGVFEVWARVSKPGTTSLISGPNAPQQP